MLEDDTPMTQITWEVDVLSAAAGAPNDAERQYRALLWLHHQDLSLS